MNVDSEAENIQGLSQTISVFIWGLIMAKAKTGYTAATNKNSEQVSGQFKSILVLLAMAAVATLAQIQIDKHSTPLVAPTNSDSVDVSFKGRNLAGLKLQDSNKFEDNVNFRDLLKRSEESWNIAK
jgi:hypothetical protein